MVRITVVALSALLVTLLATAVNAQTRSINLYAWSEYVPQSVIDKFTEDTGIAVNYETYASNEEMMSKLLAGATQYDLIQPSEYTIEALIRANQLAPLDKAKLANLKNIDPQYLEMAHDPGQKYSVPWMAGTVGIVYNTDAIKDDIKGYKEVFGGKYAGRIVAVDDARELVTWALNYLGLDQNDVTATSLEKAKPVLAEWMKQIKLYDSDSPKTALLNGEVDIGIVWSGEAATLHQEAPGKFKYVLPAEGAHMFLDNLAIPKNAPNKDAAHQFINFVLRPEISVLISEEFPYTNPNAEARKQLGEDQLNNPASYPPGSPKLSIFRDIGQVASDIDQLVTDLKAANE